jgi:chemotaxis protein methyltransferase CheR
MSNRATEMAFLCELVKERSAIALDPRREYLMEARLATIARQAGLKTVSDLIACLRAGGQPDLQWKAVEAMTTNETSFFRDIKPFEAMKQTILPALIKAREKERRISIWCGACSTGQEPYSLCMMLREHFPALQGWNISFLATDICSEVLERARQGIYSQLEVNRGLPAHLLLKYFKKTGDQWTIDSGIRKMVSFQRMNLAAPWPPMGSLDVIMLRNVMIYFPAETKKQILKNIRQVLRRDGYLFLGTAETTINLDPTYVCESYDLISYYRPGPQPA